MSLNLINIIQMGNYYFYSGYYVYVGKTKRNHFKTYSIFLYRNLKTLAKIIFILL